MKVVEYDEVDPHQVFYLNQLALDFALTPELVAHVRHSDPRPLPCLAVYAVEDGIVLGQVGVFRLPMISTEGREDVGGIWAVSTHPQHSGHGVASCLIEEAHARMREAGLRFSTLQTNRYRVAYKLYRQHGYQDTQILGTALARWETAHQPTRLHARPLGPEGYDFVERLFTDVASNYLGYAWRHTPFHRLRDMVRMDDIWILWQNDQPIGYALANVNGDILKLTNLLLKQGIDAAEAVAAVVTRMKTPYVQVRISRPSEVAALQCAGYEVACPNWHAFMVKPLVPEVTAEDARRVFAIGTDRFLISWLDVT